MPTSPCPYCGQPTDPASAGDAAPRCASCGGHLEPLSRTATQLAMGPWQIRDEARPFMPGFSSEVLRKQVAAGRIKRESILRGPTTYQFWMRADESPGVSALLGICHACRSEVAAGKTNCDKCNADLTLPDGVDTLGLMYVSEQSRRDAQAQISASQSDPAAARLTPVAKPKAAAGTALSADSLKPINKPNPKPAGDKTDPASARSESGAAADDARDHDGPADAIEGLSDASDVTPKRRSKKRGSNGTIIGLLVVSLVVMVIAGTVLIGSEGNGSDNGDQQDPSAGTSANQANRDTRANRVPTFNAAMVQGVQSEVQTLLDKVREEEVPADLQPQLDEQLLLIDQAKAANDRADYEAAFGSYSQALGGLSSFQDLRTRYFEDAQVRGEANQAKAQMQQAKQQAAELEAPKLAADLWSRGEDLAGLAEQRMGEAAYEEAADHYAEAATAYEEALATVRLATQAREAHEQFNELVNNSAPRQLLEEHAAEQFTSVTERRNQAMAALRQGDYRVAMDRYAQARDALNQANRLVDLARGRPYYAYLAGYAAADALLVLASGDPMTAQAASQLTSTMDALQLPAGLASDLPKAQATPEDYDALANVLFSRVRQHLLDRFGKPVQLSYAIGVQARILQKTLSFDVMTSDHRSSAGAGVRQIEVYASEAGWDTAALNPALDSFRTALRQDTVGQKAEKAPAAWAEVLALLSSQDRGRRLMTVDKIENLESPELFPDN